MVEQMRQLQGVSEELKANNPIKWNCTRQQAEEIVLKEKGLIN